ncbi:unnamed protein product [Durusdinium trenchii]|uniref:Uncharacterized protein n=1 Tax=Durusdinium trenchii TaxID=1381693 RepID=A0ABP0P9J3_9DINO
MFTVAPLFTPWPFAMARRERRAKRMADWYGLAVEGERGAAAKKQCVARAEEVAEKLPPGAAKGLQNAAPSGPEGIDPITMERLLSQVQKGGPSVQNEALVAVTGLPPQHAAKLLEFALEKSKELRDPSMYMVSTVARGFKPRWHEMVEASVPSKGWFDALQRRKEKAYNLSWRKIESRTKPGVFYWENFHTGQRSVDDPRRPVSPSPVLPSRCLEMRLGAAEGPASLDHHWADVNPVRLCCVMSDAEQKLTAERSMAGEA